MIIFYNEFFNQYEIRQKDRVLFSSSRAGLDDQARLMVSLPYGLAVH
jgi:hypothetical protein